MNNETQRPTETSPLIPDATTQKRAMLWIQLQQRGSIEIQTTGEALDTIAGNLRKRIEKDLRNQTVVMEHRLLTRKS